VIYAIPAKNDFMPAPTLHIEPQKFSNTHFLNSSCAGNTFSVRMYPSINWSMCLA
jgi:hypothetical protein